MIPVQTRVRGSRPAALLSEGYGYIVNKMLLFYENRKENATHRCVVSLGFQV